MYWESDLWFRTNAVSVRLKSWSDNVQEQTCDMLTRCARSRLSGIDFSFQTVLISVSKIKSTVSLENRGLFDEVKGRAGDGVGDLFISKLEFSLLSFCDVVETKYDLEK